MFCSYWLAILKLQCFTSLSLKVFLVTLSLSHTLYRSFYTCRKFIRCTISSWWRLNSFVLNCICCFRYHHCYCRYPHNDNCCQYYYKLKLDFSPTWTIYIPYRKVWHISYSRISRIVILFIVRLGIICTFYYFHCLCIL